MRLLFLTLFLRFSCLRSLTEANSWHQARMIFTTKETAVKRFQLPGHHAPVKILLQEQADTVTAIGKTHLYLYNFYSPQKAPAERKVIWKECTDRSPQTDCSYNITVVHKRKEANQVFLCGTNVKETLCCDMKSKYIKRSTFKIVAVFESANAYTYMNRNLSNQSSTCIPSAKIQQLQRSIRKFNIKDGEPSALLESGESADLYITYSGSQDKVGIHRFGEVGVRPAHHGKEQHYVNLILSRREDSLQDKVYAFYKEKNRDTGLESDMWLPFVTQVCMADIGGPKNNLQFSWTSQMNARLYCGDHDSRQHFSELVDVAIVHADDWQNTRVYALFRNEWDMSAVCVYTIRDISDIFMTSPFKGYSKDNQKNRNRECVRDSTKISIEDLRMIEKTSEMELWVQPVNKSGPILFNHHNYTHIYVDTSQSKGNDHYTVLFLAKYNGGVHKVIQTNSQTFVIAEYRPFNHQAHILTLNLHPSSRKLYVDSRSELIQLDVANCAKYGDSCEECVLARDPYCGWNGTRCTPQTHDVLQNVVTGNYTICLVQPEKAFRHAIVTRADSNVDSITLPSQSRYFLRCPVSSHHAQYTWHHDKCPTPCRSKNQECLLLIDSMDPEQAGTYRCVSEELGYRKVLAQYHLQLESRAAGQLSSPLIWICLMAALIKSLSCKLL